MAEAVHILWHDLRVWSLERFWIAHFGATRWQQRKPHFYCILVDGREYYRRIFNEGTEEF